ncbi:MAG: 30S ribosomal protein S6 [Opitutales bacterium]|nr:30S ribosomal protein S6 [Opitutales bacterium]
MEGVKKEIAAVQGDVTAVENIGKKDFVRVTDKKLTGATYVHVNFSAPSEGPSQLKERLRLNHSVYRTFVQSV